MVDPAATVLVPLVLVTTNEVAGATVDVAVKTLLPIDESKTVPVVFALTELLTVPVKLFSNGAVTTNCTVELIDKSTVLLILPVPLAALQAVVTTVVNTPGLITVHVQVADPMANTAGSSVSMTVTAAATAGPALATLMV